MLAKEIKIRTIKQQRETIEKEIKKMASCKRDGDAAYRYVGHVYPENIEYFKGEGFDVTKVESDMLTAATNGLPVYLFTVSDDVVLTAEEIQQAEAWETKDDGDDFFSFLEMMMNQNSEEPEEDPEKDPDGEYPD